MVVGVYKIGKIVNNVYEFMSKTLVSQFINQLVSSNHTVLREESLQDDLTTAQSKLHAIASLVKGYVCEHPDSFPVSTLANSVMQIIGSTTKPAALLEAEVKVQDLD